MCSTVLLFEATIIYTSNKTLVKIKYNKHISRRYQITINIYKNILMQKNVGITLSKQHF